MFRWLLGLFRKHEIVKVVTVMQQDEPRKNFVCVKVVRPEHLAEPDQSFDLTFSLLTVVAIYGIDLENIDQEYSCIEFVNGSQYYALLEINTLLEILGIDIDDDDDDEEDDEPATDDSPPELTRDQFDAMLS